LDWIKSYLKERTDKNKALFVTTGENPRRACHVAFDMKESEGLFQLK